MVLSGVAGEVTEHLTPDDQFSIDVRGQEAQVLVSDGFFVAVWREPTAHGLCEQYTVMTEGLTRSQVIGVLESIE